MKRKESVLGALTIRIHGVNILPFAVAAECFANVPVVSANAMTPVCRIVSNPHNNYAPMQWKTIILRCPNGFSGE